MRNGREGVQIVAVDDQPGDLVAFIGHQRFIEEGLERQLGQRHLGHGTLFSATCNHASEAVAGPCRRGLGHQVAEVAKLVGSVAQHITVLRAHRASTPAIGVRFG